MVKSDRLLVFGGCYGNLQATTAVLARADELGFGTEQIICTGDTVAYCAQPQETVELLRHRGIAVVMGNCEDSLAADSDDCGCGFAEGTACDLLSAEWYSFCQANLSVDAKQWMGTLPRSVTIKIGNRCLLATHAVPDSINQFVFADIDADIKQAQLAQSDHHGLLVGHSGIPFGEFHENRLWLNSGALGMPANDGTPRGWYAVLESTIDGLTVSIQSLEYDWQTAATVMRERGLDNGYASCLESGLWPSLDVLPEQHRGRTGIPLSPCYLTWPDANLTE